MHCWGSLPLYHVCASFRNSQSLFTLRNANAVNETSVGAIGRRLIEDTDKNVIPAAPVYHNTYSRPAGNEQAYVPPSNPSMGPVGVSSNDQIAFPPAFNNRLSNALPPESPDGEQDLVLLNSSTMDNPRTSHISHGSNVSQSRNLPQMHTSATTAPPTYQDTLDDIAARYHHGANNV